VCGTKVPQIKSCSRIALCWMARSARGDVRWVAAVFVGTVETEKRCSAISSCRSAARTSRIRRRRAITDARSSGDGPAGANSSALGVSRAESGYGARQPPPRA
jgi:hypothetical protein